MNIDLEKLLSECRYAFSRSGGKGGQNVNKVETKVELNFDVLNSPTLTGEQRFLLTEKLHTKLTKDFLLKIVSQTERTQLGNKKKADRKFIALIKKAFTPEKKRIKTKPSKAVKQKRLESKRKQSEKKISRRKKNHTE